eukprot:933085-Pelagomonas_calceolata.AAC.4
MHPCAGDAAQTASQLEASTINAHLPIHVGFKGQMAPGNLITASIATLPTPEGPQSGAGDAAWTAVQL